MQKFLLALLILTSNIQAIAPNKTQELDDVDIKTALQKIDQLTNQIEADQKLKELAYKIEIIEKRSAHPDGSTGSPRADVSRDRSVFARIWQKVCSATSTSFSFMKNHTKTALFLTAVATGAIIAASSYLPGGERLVRGPLNWVAGKIAKTTVKGGEALFDATVKATTNAINENPQLREKFVVEVGHVMAELEAAKTDAKFAAAWHHPFYAVGCFFNKAVPVVFAAISPFLLERYKARINPANKR